MQHTPKVERILVCINFTDTSRRAFYAGLDLAAYHGAETWVFHVAEPIHAYDFAKRIYVETKEVIERVEEGVQRRVDELWKEGGRDAVDRRRVHTLVRGGRAATEILAAAEAKDVHLIVMGAGRQGDNIGHTAERVTRDACCSVYCVR
jgi:nucleotide-binding universal stress UspA family protein